MTTFHLSINDLALGSYEADSAQEARDMCAADAGYKDECDMAVQLERPSALVAEAVEDTDPLNDFSYAGSRHHY